MSKKKNRKKKNISSNTIICISVGIVLLIVLVSIFIGTRESVSYTIELNGDSNVVVYKNGNYNDPGAKAYDSNNKDLSKNIKVINNVNISKAGKYEIVYKLDDIYVKRVVKVIDKPSVNNQNLDKDNINKKSGETTITLKGNETIYIELYGNYKEEGFTAVDTIDGNIKKKVKVTHNVDNKKPGKYQVIYTVKNSSGITTSVVRNIIVMKVDLNLTLENLNYTNGNVKINVSVDDEYFDYLLLPNGITTNEKNCSFTVSNNGTYTFKLFNKNGVVKEKSIVVENIDREVPIGSCSGYFKDGVSYITVNASDNVKIGSYVVNGNSYSSNNIKINTEITSANVDIYDVVGNKSSVSCNIVDKNEFITSDKSITFSYQFKTDSDLAYGLYTPSTASNGKKTPLIIWLHGSGSVGADNSKFKNNFLSYMKDWKLEGFNAYILCPLLKHGSWNNQQNKAKVYTLVDKILKEKNIDTDKIILAGHSMGAQGIFNIADGKSNFYSALVFMSPYKATPSTIDITQFKNVPLIGYVGTVAAGEDETSYKYATKTFSNTYGSDKMIVVNTWHGNVPKYVFNIDSNKDNKSDLIEWMLMQ